MLDDAASCDLFSQVMDRSTSDLLVCGGDSRLRVNPRTGLNKYGCATTPNPAILGLGSCTASTVSPCGYQAAAALHAKLRQSACPTELDVALAHVHEELRKRIAAQLDIHRVRHDSVVLVPSGTDAELIALTLANADGSKPICNVMVGPQEVGSGSVLAASGRYFDVQVPNMSWPNRNVIHVHGAVDERLAANTRLATIDVRDRSGMPRDPCDIDREVLELVESKIRGGHRVLLHVLAHSKTGIYAPALKTMRVLETRFGANLVTFVDAAQGRSSRTMLVEHLRHGRMICVTGSKFYGGPPFAACLLIPPNLQPRMMNLRSVPVGFGHFFTASQWPTQWHGVRELLPRGHNVGLALRWQAALAEMRRYYGIPASIRRRVWQACVSAVSHELKASQYIDLQASPGQDGDRQGTISESLASVFSFVLRHQQPSRAEWSEVELQKCHHWLAHDIASNVVAANAEEERVLAAQFQIGQPVRLSEDRPSARTALRVALSAPLLVQVHADRACGETLEDRISWFNQQMGILRRKMDLIVQHACHLHRSDVAPGSVRAA